MTTSLDETLERARQVREALYSGELYKQERGSFMFSTVDEVRAQKAAHLVHECWSGRVQPHWRKTLTTLRRHWLNGTWQPGEARRLIRYNLRDAYRYLKDELIDTPVFDMAEDTLYESVQRLFRADRG